MHVTNIWFLIWNIVCGFARNSGELITARLLAGLGASAIYALQSGVLGDVWRPEHRVEVMGIYSLIPSLGAAVGPIIGGLITERTTWRWMFWSTSILQGVMVCMCLAMFRETHGPTILRKRARALRRNTGDSRYHTQWDSVELGRSIFWILRRSLSRPFECYSSIRSFKYKRASLDPFTAFYTWSSQHLRICGPRNITNQSPSVVSTTCLCA
jgi:MFS family permease